MKVIICGAGAVGGNIASYLSNENNDVTVIDTNQATLDALSERCDIRTICGHASHPGILEQAGANEAEMIIASTQSDEVNMMACQIAHTLFNVPKKVARIRQREYLDPMWVKLFSRDQLPIDNIISPELEVASAIVRRILVPGAFNIIPVVDNNVSVIGVICQEECPIIHTPLKDIQRLFPDLSLSILAIIRDEEVILPKPDEQILARDEVYFAVDRRQRNRAMDVFGHGEPDANNVLIVGGGHVGAFLAQWIEENRPNITMKIIECSAERASFLAETLSKTIVINGDALDHKILKEAGVEHTQTVIAVTNDDETNILGSLLAKKYGCQRAITLINKTTYSPLINSLGMDAVVNPYAITVSSIMQHVRRGRIRALHTLRDGFAEVMDLEALDSSSIVHIAFDDLELPEGVVIGLIKRGDKIIVPHGAVMIKPKDRVVVLAAKGQARAVEKLFSVRSDYF